MDWFRKPKYTKLDAPKMKDRIPHDLMVKCENCVNMVLKEQYEKNLWVCPKCDYHSKLTARQRIAITFDSFEEDNLALKPTDPLGFFDTKAYSERLKSYQGATGLNDACLSGVATLSGFKVAAAVMDFSFIGGSMGAVVGEKVTRVVERGLAESLPVIVFSCSGGARMQEGILSLM
ncbi:MAG: acetyl-CoA carboxylase carboxyltransferase subunit beta, partial [Candidatus Sumerlaeota bacterium]|nr:acetyl-CoA carboxylase carboxyltransferase subunit beta [Candidatus Sumerlaeota bacterium]